MEYNFKKIEQKWQKKWEKERIYEVKENPQKDKFYCLIEFPYPSGEGLHVGHPRSYTALDIVARKNRMQGQNVLYPIGWDAFGLPTENYAIKTGIQPAVATEKNIKNFTRQLKSLGFSFDWSREINTADPKYYKWTQWMFLQFFKHGLAYKDKIAINWCTKCKIGLANEEVVNGVCERCGGTVVKKMKEQWMIKITKYAERLLEGLKKVDYSPRIKEGQINWIGKSEGAEVDFHVVIASEAKQSHNGGIAASPSAPRNDIVKVFTTRPDTLFGVTYIVLAPEHELVQKLKSKITNWNEVEKYIGEAKGRSDLERQESSEKTGVGLKGIKAINPVNNEEIPIWVADYVLTGYGTGAIMAVPAHDERDFEFAKKFGLSIREVVKSNGVPALAGESLTKVRSPECVYAGEGTAINSDFLDGLLTAEAKEKITKWLEEKNIGKKAVNYKLRDWVFSRQRYWGEPIPLVYCETCAKKKQKVLLIHGFEGSGEGNWLPWLKKELEARGFEVFNPTISTSEHPTVESWMEELMPFMGKMGEDDIIVGHSLGSKAALHLVEKAKKKIGHLFLIASAVGSVEERDWSWFRKELKGSDIDALRKFWEAPVKWETVDKLVGSKDLVLSDDDPYIKKEMYKNLPPGWNYELWSGFGHFDMKQVPKLLDLVLTAKNTGWVPVREKDLPVELPKVKKYEPTDTGESPLAAIEKWVKTKCPKCNGVARRETDTMPNWAGSSWYFLRYCDPRNNKDFLKFSSFLPTPAIEATEKDKKYFTVFKKIYSDLKQKNITVWAGNRFLLNGINGNLWVPLRTISLMTFQKKEVEKYLGEQGFEVSEEHSGNIVFGKDGVRAEIVPMYKDGEDIYSLTYGGAKQNMFARDLPEDELAQLWGFSYRIVSPQYNLAHYKYINKYEVDDRKGLGDKDKIKFLENWLSGVNEKLRYWMPVDWYNGGMEHTTLHLLYSRFWYKFLYDIGVIPKECGDEPYKKRTSHGLILGEGGEKMSKSRGNVVNPDDIVARFGADTLRVYEMFMGPFEQAIPWDEKGVVGVFRFLERVWKLSDKVVNGKNKISSEAERLLNKTIKKVGEDIEAMKFNTAVSQLMILTNAMADEKIISREAWQDFLKTLAPFAPHLAEELWEKTGNKKSIHLADWPKYDPKLIVEEEIDLIIQINGKVRDTIRVKSDISEEEARKVATESEKVKKWIEGQKIKKIIFVKGRLVNIVI
ncbi:MAG: leucine--tRNA ligase [Patescibacteria group bacterium]